MQLNKADADIFVPDATPLADALARTTHLGIGAHQDDLEIMAYHGILAGFGRREQWFSGVTVTDGAGSARTGLYADYSDAEMRAVRLQEQRTAAVIGQYSAMLQVNYASSEVKGVDRRHLIADLVAVLEATRPQVVYTHNPFDKHATHVATTLAVLAALRQLPAAARPAKVYGCEVWRDLDWLPDQRKIAFDVGGREHLAAALVGVYDSQIAGGKRYDLASLGRRRANATYLQSHATDASEAVIFAVDLSECMQCREHELLAYVRAEIDNFSAAVCANLQSLAMPPC